MKYLYHFIVAAACSLTATVHAAECSKDVAYYVYSSQPSLHAKLESIKKDGQPREVGVEIKDSTHNLNYWFLVDKGAGYYASLISTTNYALPDWKHPDPDGPRKLRDMEIYGWDKRMKMSDDLRTDRPLPDYIFVPALAELVTHAIPESYHLPPGFFKRAACNI
ncbi:MULTISPECIES: hypothetical protein [Xanthomonas]|uniref:hypothetical protein n=1 Tax=Xanthomonas TaxID=338 RepID=UPI00137085B3|nr:MULTISPECIES: hypothetical protein [Xanthomonas]MBB4770758.1 hypothetical protein [Xanthomonas arboricola]MCC5091274.1 hypothetical protein [Xanthomonas campestris]MCW1981204.1 hypothetical protein [Xanthomonas campestris]MCW2006539.1 hypothetical protein [Xanthomonas campestris]